MHLQCWGRVAVMATAMAGVPEVAKAERRSECTVSGTVSEASGQAVRSAIVNAFRADSPLVPQAAGVVTNERGAYCIPALPAGTYLIQAYVPAGPPSASPSCSSCCDAATGYAETYHPGVVDTAHATRVTVRQGRALRGIDVRLRRTPVYCVRGEVRNSTGELIDAPTLRLERTGLLHESSGVIVEGGRFLLTNLSPGTYRLIVLHPRRIGEVLASRTIRVSGRNIDGMVVTTPPVAP